MATGLMSAANSLGMKFIDYNGQQVRVDDAYKQNLAEGASMSGMSAQDYDKMLNPTTYGARWDSSGGADNGSTTVSGSTNTTGSTSIPGTNINLPTASQVTAGGLMSTPAKAAADVTAAPATSAGYTAMQATPSENVVAQNAAAGTAVGTGYTANTTQVNAPTDTVQGQIDQIIAKNSPLMQRAEARANEQMNARGLQNSSMAVGAGQAALYDVAAPIATTDANAYNATRFNNQNATNTAAQFGAAASNQASLANAQLYTDVSKSNADRALQAGIINQDQANKIAMFNAQSVNTASQFTAASANDMARFNADQLLKAGIINQQQANDMAKFNTDTSAKLALAQLQNSTDVAKFNASQSNDLIKLGMDATTRTNLANIEASYKVLMQSSAGASDLYKQAITSLAGILSNKDIADKAGAMNDIMSGLNEGLGILGDIANLNLGSTLNFSSGAENSEAAASPAIPGLMGSQAGGVGGVGMGGIGGGGLGGVNGSAGTGDGGAMG